jgi:hypothetical protein
LIVGQLVNIWLSVGSAIAAQTYPGLELTASTNCSSTVDSKFSSSTVDEQLFSTHFDSNMFSAKFDVDVDFWSTNASSYQPPQRGEFSDIYRLSYNLYPIIGFLLTGMTCIFASLATGGISQMKKVEKRLIHPFMWKIFRLKDDAVENK